MQTHDMSIQDTDAVAAASPRSMRGRIDRVHTGFTLIELVIVMTILAILAALVIPQYTTQIRKGRRADAKSALLDLASREEKFYATNNTYTNVPASLGYSGTFPVNVTTSGTSYYQLTVTAATGTTFTATAAPTGDQTNDGCGTYQINQAGTQSVSGTGAQCW